MDHQRGQVLVIFVFASIVLIGAAAIAADASWLFVNQQRMQRAADAAALAGAVYLPGDPASAFATARAEAARNGYQHQAGGVDVQPRTDPGNPRRLIVDIDQAVGTFFARVMCWDGGPCLRDVDVGVQGRAEYVLPVPMGSPQNYYGVGHFVDAVTTTTTTTRTESTGWTGPGRVVSGGEWSNPHYVGTNDNRYASEGTRGDSQQWNDFGFLGDIPNDPSVVIEGLEVRLEDTYLTGSGNYSNCLLYAEHSWDGGNSWSDYAGAGPLDTDYRSDHEVGSSSSTSVWGSHVWQRADFSDGNYRLRLTWWDGTGGCDSGRAVRVDEIEVRVTYTYVDVDVDTDIGEADVVSPYGDVLAPQNFWGAMQSQGAPNIQGDAYMTYYDDRTSHTNSDYDPEVYYQYAIEFPPGSSGGEVWLFDPGFCHVDSNKGTGENWNTGGSYGYSPHQPVSAFYDLYDTRNTLYHTTDDTVVASSGSLFKHLYLRDHELDVSGSLSAPDCSGESWHNSWWKLADGLSGNKTYRLHSYSTDPTNANDQRNTTALNSFAIFATSNGAAPRVYGLGAMEAYVRLPGGRSSEFYLAQIDAEHAGKTMVIKLWDPGDTGDLSADLQILRPTATSYVPTNFSYSARKGSTHSNTSECNSRSGTNVDSVVTNSGGYSRFNGCWLTIEIPLPTDYTAPHPSSDTVASAGGWWKIRYNMSGSIYDNSTDLTTWEVELRGSPVHLVIP